MAEGDRLLHEEGRRHLLGRAGQPALLGGVVVGHRAGAVALGAEVTLVSAGGERRIPVAELYHDDGIDYLTKRPDEILTEIRAAAPDGDWRASTGSCAGAARSTSRCSAWPPRRASSTAMVTEARIVITGAGSRPHDRVDAAALLVGKRIDDRDVDRRGAAERAARIAKPLDNTDFALGWRKEMARHHVMAALTDRADSRYDAGP